MTHITRFTREELQEAHDNGRIAYFTGSQVEDNQYDEILEGELHHKWEEGFLEAEEEDNVLENEEDLIE